MQTAVTFGAADRPSIVGELEVVTTVHGAGLELPRHDHEPATLVLVEDGDFCETVGRRSFQCVPDVVLVKPAGAHHSNRYGGAGSRATLITLPRHYPVREVMFIRNAALTSRLRFELSHGDAASALAAECLVLELLVPTKQTGAAPGKPPRWIRAIEEQLRDEPIATLSAMAESAGRHPSHLARAFRLAYGCSPGEYARSVRVQRACELLRRTEEPLAAVALEAGFYDQSHFSNVFRQLVGLTPSRYRRMHRSSKTSCFAEP